MLKSDSAPTGGEAAERAVEAARKAAFEGANEYPKSGAKSTKSSGSASSSPSVTPSSAVARNKRETSQHIPSVPTTPFITAYAWGERGLKGTMATTDTPSTTSSSGDRGGDRRGSIKAITAAEILKGMLGKSCFEEEEGSPVVSDASEQADADFKMPDWIFEKRGNIPSWVEKNLPSFGERLVIPEFDSLEHRGTHGWKGRDFMHDEASPVRILDYHVNYGDGIGSLAKGGEGTTLTGVVHFSKKAESHQGFCHGGGMTAVMDDVIGWAGFLATGSCQPWTGFTAQINSSLRKPIPVDSWLLICGTIAKISGRKVSVLATLIDPANGDAVHAEGDGLVILNSGVLPDT